MSADLYVSLSPLYVRPRASPGRCGRLYGRVVKSIWVGVTNGTHHRETDAPWAWLVKVNLGTLAKREMSAELGGISHVKPGI